MRTPISCKLAANTSGDDLSSIFFSAKDARVKLGHDELCRRSAVMFLGNADLIQLPQSPELSLGRLENVQVNILYSHAGIDRFQN